MTDFRDFDEPYGKRGVSPDDRSTRWVLIVCFGILVLAGIAFASIGKLGEPITAVLADARRAPPQAMMISPGSLQLPPDRQRVSD